MSFDIVKETAANPELTKWVNDMKARLDQKMTYGVKKANEVDYMPYSTENGQWKKTDIGWWTNGFWPATMWQMFRMTGKELYRDEAIRTEKMLDAALANFKNLSHDVGFMWLIHSGVRYALEKNADSYDRTLFAADVLAGRFNPNGFIRAWNGQGREGWAIIDCMMNLPILYWASEVTGDPRYKLIAMKHADTSMQAFVRPDGSCNHIVIFDPMTGVPKCDFRQPKDPDLRDNAAGNIAASGLLEIARLVPECEGRMYYEAALKILQAQEKTCADWTEATPAVFTKCTSAYHDIPGRHIQMNYGDFYFVEAIGKLLGEKLLAWYPNRED